jgi:hypothetical protein
MPVRLRMRVSTPDVAAHLLLAKGRAAGARFACPSGSRQPVADRVASWDQEHPRRQALPARLLHQQSVGALTGCEAFPSHGRRSRNRLGGGVRHRDVGAVPSASKQQRGPIRRRAFRDRPSRQRPAARRRYSSAPQSRIGATLPHPHSSSKLRHVAERRGRVQQNRSVAGARQRSRVDRRVPGENGPERGVRASGVNRLAA